MIFIIQINKSIEMSEEKASVKKPFKGAKVDWPADMPDDMLEDAITIAKKALDEHDFEEQGVEVGKINCVA